MYLQCMQSSPWGKMQINYSYLLNRIPSQHTNQQQHQKNESQSGGNEIWCIADEYLYY